MSLTYTFVRAWLTSQVRSERGASLVEYALLIGLIALVCIVGLTTLGSKTSSSYDSMASLL